MSDFTQDAKSLLNDIGGKENINAVTHCATRMRFVLNDPKQADIDAIEDIPSVKGTFTQSGQFQVIIGGIRILWWKRAYKLLFSNFLISVEKSTP